LILSHARFERESPTQTPRQRGFRRAHPFAEKVRQRLGLAAGDELDVEFPVTGLDCAGEDAILLRVVRPEVPLRRDGKFWVYRGGEAQAAVDVAGMVAAEREARSESILPGSTCLQPPAEEGAEP
jgi:hypothetical protein